MTRTTKEHLSRFPAGTRIGDWRTLHQMVQHWERQSVEEALHRCNHHRGHADRLLEPSRSSTGYPGIVEDYRRIFAKARAMKVDFLLAPPPELFDMSGKRAKQKDGAPNPFISPSEFKPFIEKLEAAFEKFLAGR
ncbi:MAG TPA: hypothetical protein VK539_26560 [Myxococcaceae bacterium]|nr:hypothetical protein [Myxococcaceae bacterium]